MNLERIVADLVEKVERRYYGKYRGFVVDNADPEQLGRLKLRVPSVLGNDVVTGWALPCTPYGGAANQGFLFIPEIDTGVWVEFEEGDLEFPIWVGAFWSKAGGESELPKPNQADGTDESAVQDPPTRKIIKTMKGHTIQFEDQEDEELIRIYEGANHHVITLNKDGIQITDGANSHIIAMSNAGISIKDGVNNSTIVMNQDGIKVVDGANDNTLVMDKEGFSATDATGNVIAMKMNAFNITAKVAFTVDASGQAVVIKAKTIDFNKA